MMYKLPTVALLASVMMAGSALAAEPALVSTSKSWNAYEFTESGNKVCYMASKPTASLPTGVNRGDIYAMITHRPGEKSLGVVSFVVGYSYKNGSEATVTIGNQRFALFTDGDTAWARDDATDKALVAAIKSGDKMVLVGTSSRGTQTTDTFSLSGSGAAYKTISDRCGVK